MEKKRGCVGRGGRHGQHGWDSIKGMGLHKELLSPVQTYSMTARVATLAGNRGEEEAESGFLARAEWKDVGELLAQESSRRYQSRSSRNLSIPS